MMMMIHDMISMMSWHGLLVYETELRELAEFVPELANLKEYLWSKFEEGLTLEIQEKMSVSGSQSYKEAV